MGIYTSSTGFFSLCEAEGFRRITPFLDRPDVMARYTVTLHAERERYPVLLANGNLVAHGEEGGGRHWAKWVDPFPKPCYLFAVVAARLDRSQDSFRTRSGRNVQLQFFVEPGKLDQGVFAMESLKHAMKWDEDTYGLEVDLDEYNIVAVGDFNAGAMENKGLNIFNTKLVLARPDISTDGDFNFIDRTVAHEYFHNWTGNRVTCRDWFQLSLEGRPHGIPRAAVRRRRYSRAVARIQAVRKLRSGPVSRRRGADGAPGTAVLLPAGEQLLHLHDLPEGGRGGAHAAHAGRRRELPQGRGPVLPAPRRAGGDHGGTGAGDGAGERARPRAVRAGTAVGHAAAGRARPVRRSHAHLRAHGEPELPAHARPAHQEADAHPAGGGPGRPAGTRIRPAAGRRADGGGTSAVLSLRRETEVFRFLDVPARPVPSLGRNFSAPVVIDYATTNPRCRRSSASTATPSTAGKPASGSRWTCC